MIATSRFTPAGTVSCTFKKAHAVRTPPFPARPGPRACPSARPTGSATPGKADQGSAARHQGPARLQQLGRQRDDGGLRAAFHAALVPQVVVAARGQHRLRRSSSFLVLEAVGGTLLVDYGFVNAFWAILATGLIIFLAGWPISVYAARHGVDMDLLTARCRLRLHRLDHHLADLRELHLHLLRARGGHHGLRDRARLRHPAGLGLPAVLAAGDPAGHARRDDDQPAAGVDAAAVAGDADRALRLRAAAASDRAAGHLGLRWRRGRWPTRRRRPASTC